MLKRKGKFIGHLFNYYTYMGIVHQAKIISTAMLDVVYPNHCATCAQDLNSNEQFLCLTCLYDLPYIAADKSNELRLNQLFWGREDVQNTFSLFNYQKGNQVQDLLHLIKYQKKTNLARFFGAKLGQVISSAAEIDCIIPVPLHPKKLKTRGFNQSSLIAKGISDTLTLPVNEKLVKRIVHNPTQTSVSKYERWNNVRDIFQVPNPSKLIGKHVLLVDDVLTTGATLEACIKQLLKVENCKVSVATLAARI